MTLLQSLADYLRWHHPNYTVEDVALSTVPGFLRCTKPCRRRSRWPGCPDKEHFHTISIVGAGYPPRDEKGRFVSRYRLWRELHGLLPQEK